MFRNVIATKYHFTVLTGLFLLALSAAASAAAPTAELGKSQPNAPDFSLQAGWHVYVFHRDNVEYVQVNDAGNNVRAAFANANGQTLVLPMGLDAEQVAVQQQSMPVPVNAASATVYRDNQVEVVMSPQQTSTAWVVRPAGKVSTASSCSAVGCTGISNGK